MKEVEAVLRANRNGFDTVMQIHDRLSTISLSGHNVDKLEIIALGGTFSCYPEEYQESFSRDVYYAANTFFDNRETPRERLSVEEEIKLNETARVRIIGYTIEDRLITVIMLLFFKNIGDLVLLVFKLVFNILIRDYLIK